MWTDAMQSRFITFQRQLSARFAAQDYLDERHFFLTLMAALMLHLMCLVAWHLSPSTRVVDIPVHALNIKLGDDGGDEAEAKAEQQAGNSNNVENTLSRLVHEDTPQEAAHAQAEATKSLDKAMTTVTKAAIPDDPTMLHDSTRKLSDAARQFVRDRGTKVKLRGSTSGNSKERSAEIATRYEQLVSLWILKFQVYPPEARAQNMRGDTVVRIRIDRQGNIVYYLLEHSTGYAPLDRAAIDMIRRANPVPALPDEYPAGEFIEFLVPVTFKLQ